MITGAVLPGGINDSTNLQITFGIILVLISLSSITKILDFKGILAAASLGAIIGCLGHWSWLVILLSFLITAHLATKWSWERKTKLRLNESNDGSRGWKNVISNGGIPGAVAIFAFIIQDWTLTLPLYISTVCVASADTWASEFGSLDPRVKLIISNEIVPPGTNGGFSPTGQKAAFVGSFLIGVFGLIFAWLPSEFSINTCIYWSSISIIAGWLGCQFDSLIGALYENRGWISKGGVNNAAIGFGLLFTIVFVIF
ncbi:MAG: hypothetical protein CMB48_07650 [Euryarchaeota archaeon]|nr:hypothetical protein [Euryarchaeota archaeon]|tara:strand:- start:1319 stop:2086 length:768 start_codon:yes stop_codon:yes gene_type:complete